MKTFVLIAGMWLNVDYIESFEVGYYDGMFHKSHWCHVNMVSGDYFTIKDESCADIVRDVTTQMEDPN